MSRSLHWLLYTVPGNLVSAVIFYPIGLIWWSATNDLIWTGIGLVVGLSMIPLHRRLEDRQTRKDTT